MIERTISEINEMVGRALDNPCVYPGMSYAEGVAAALDWVTGHIDEEPITAEDANDG